MQMQLLRLVFVVALALMAPGLVGAQGASDESIRQYLKLSGQEASVIESINRIAPILRQLNKDVPEELWREVTRTDNVLAFLIPVHRNHFSEQEMQDLIAFYKTPTGIKAGALASTVQQEMADLGTRQIQAAIVNYQVQKGHFTVEPKK